MKHILILAKRVIKQLYHNKRFLALSIMAPFLIIYFLKTNFDTFGAHFPVERYIMPAAVFIVHFLSFILCSILVVQERNNGTLARLFVSGFKKIEIIAGFMLGYLGLATIQSAIVLGEVFYLFDLSYTAETVLSLLLVFWLLAIVSVMLGIFISTFARNEAQVFPFIPLIIMPSVFFSGFLTDASLLPTWAQWLGHAMPLYYANQIVLELIKDDGALINKLNDLYILILYGVGLVIAGSFTLNKYSE
jgi:ABC-2 type transport system permease protein